MEFTFTEHYVFESKPVFRDSFFIHPIQDMGDDFKGFEINPYTYDDNVAVYDNLIFVLEDNISQRHWNIEGRRSRISIGDEYALDRGNDVRILDKHTFNELVGYVIKGLINPYVKDLVAKSKTRLIFRDEDLEESARNYVEWQLDKFLHIETSDHGIEQELSDN